MLVEDRGTGLYPAAHLRENLFNLTFGATAEAEVDGEEGGVAIMKTSIEHRAEVDLRILPGAVEHSLLRHLLLKYLLLVRRLQTRQFLPRPQ